MAINVYTVVDYYDEARKRITMQFEDAPIFNKYLKLMTQGSFELQEVLKDLMEKRSIETAEGVQLDIIGDIVGQPRILTDADLKTFFGFRGHWNSDTYGTYYDPTIGSVWWDGNEAFTGNIELNDDLYRLLIKARIAKNVTSATPEEMMRFANFVFSTQGSTVTEEGEGAFRLMLGRTLTRSEVGLLRYINTTAGYESKIFPKPVGVRTRWGSFNYDKFFAFQGIPNAKGYGSIWYKYKYDGSEIYDGSVIPRLEIEVDAEGVPYGGYWATYHEDI